MSGARPGAGYNFGGEKAEKLLAGMREIKRRRHAREANHSPNRPKEQGCKGGRL